MIDIAIRVSNLGKQYRIGAAQKRADTLRDAVAGAVRGLAQKFRRGDNGAKDSAFWALSDVNFEVRRGEVLGIIGRNGAGKSTLLKILSRITEPTTGAIDLQGRVAALLEVGTGFHAELTGRENIFLNGAILGMRRRETQRKFDEIVDFAGIDRFLDTPVKHYSSGMYMRLAFSVAAHLDPDILLVDEVLAVGDAEFQKKCLGKMDTVARSGRTVLFIGHNMQAIQQLCSRALCLDGGRVVAEGNVADVIRRRMQQTPGRQSGHDGLYEVATTALDSLGNPLVAWRTGEVMTLRVAVRGLPTSEIPVVVVSCYTMEGAWLFTLQSDMFRIESEIRSGQELILEFLITNTSIATCEAYLDVGIRDQGTVRYSALYTHILNFTIESNMERHYTWAQPLLTLPASMRLVSAS